MNEQELREENERLRRELANVREDRNSLHKIVCRMLPMDDPATVEKDLREMMDQPWYTIDDIIADLLKDEPEASPPQNQISA